MKRQRTGLERLIDPNELKFKIISLKNFFQKKRSKKYLDRKEIVSIFAPAFEDERMSPEFERREKKIFENIPYTFFLKTKQYTRLVSEDTREIGTRSIRNEGTTEYIKEKKS